MDNFDGDEQIPALNPLCSETVYKILNDYFQRAQKTPFWKNCFPTSIKENEEGIA